MNSIIEINDKAISISDLRNKLSGWKKRQNGFTALCPAHADKNPSLSIKEASGKILIHCHAGCTLDSICTSLNIKPAQLFAEKSPSFKSGSNNSFDGKNHIHYDYRNEKSELKYQCVRIESINQDGSKTKTFRYRQPDEKGGWVWSITKPPVEKLLYRLPELLASPANETVFIAEGEKDVESLLKLGLTATCNPLGAGKWEVGYNQFLQNRRCIIIPDNDEVGHSHALKVANNLLSVVAEIKILDLPDLLEKGDVTDWINAGGTREALIELAEYIPVYHETNADNSSAENQNSKEVSAQQSSRQNTAQKLLTLAEDAELFHTDDNIPYATILINDIKETIPVKSEKFADWLNSCYFEQEENVASANTIKEVRDVLSGKAKFKGKKEKNYIRIAETDSAIYLDLCDTERRAVAISESGWKIINDPPVKFVRPDGMQPLPIPEKDGNIEQLKRFLNVDNDSFVLILGWLISFLRVNYPCPVLVIQGEQGTAKTTAARVIRQLFDPNAALIRSLPNDLRDLMIAAVNNAILGFDNISHIKNDLSDSLCRISTGGSFAVRKLYTDQSESIITAIRPVIINGIGDLISRSDLLDRSIIINLSPIKKIISERAFWKDFDKAHPFILGALLNAAVTALKNLESITKEFEDENVELPRMADFALWASAAEPAFSSSSGEFLDCYERNRKAIHRTILDLDLIADLIIRFVEKNVEWSGLPAELLEALKLFADESLVRSRDFPKDPRSLGGRLARIAPNLRERGIEYLPPDRSQRTENRAIVLKLVGKPPAPTEGDQPLFKTPMIPLDIDSPFP